jgi:hypothetical protein
MIERRAQRPFAGRQQHKKAKESSFKGAIKHSESAGILRCKYMHQSE